MTTGSAVWSLGCIRGLSIPSLRSPKGKTAMTSDTAEPVQRHRGYDALTLIGWILVIVALGASAGAFFAPGDWYAGLRKPAFNPPSWIFGPVWTLLFVLMAIALWLVRRDQDATPALRSRASGWFAVQFLLNLLWTPLFFGLRSPLLAVVDISLLWLAVMATMLAFHRVRPLAAWLLLPYLGWIMFAAVLNASIWWLNLS
jgi:benzodiazapine receptor